MERREETPRGAGALQSQGGVLTLLPIPKPGCRPLLLLDLQRCHLPLFVELVIEGAHDVGRERREVFLGVHGGNSGRSPEPRNSSARGCPGGAGAGGVCGSALPPAPAHGPRRLEPACLAPPPRAVPEPGPGPRPRTPVPGHPAAHATRSRPAPTVLKGQRPCYSDHVTLQPLPPSASRTRPSPATPPHAGCGWVVHAPTRLHLLPSRTRVVRDGVCGACVPCTQVPQVVGKARDGLLCTFGSTKGLMEPDSLSTTY